MQNREIAVVVSNRVAYKLESTAKKYDYGKLAKDV